MAATCNRPDCYYHRSLGWRMYRDKLLRRRPCEANENCTEYTPGTAKPEPFKFGNRAVSDPEYEPPHDPLRSAPALDGETLKKLTKTRIEKE